MVRGRQANKEAKTSIRVGQQSPPRGIFSCNWSCENGRGHVTPLGTRQTLKRLPAESRPGPTPLATTCEGNIQLPLPLVPLTLQRLYRRREERKEAHPLLPPVSRG